MNGVTSYALITGASAGIGKAIAVECAKRKLNLILVALPGTGLAEVGNFLHRHYQVDVKIKELNLTEPPAVQDLHAWCRRQELKINVLVNNAGMGNYSSFVNTPLEKYLDLIKLNSEAVVTVAKLFLPDLREHHESYMLNVGSFASFLPIPYKSVYSATKSFVLTFSRALQSELVRYGVHVSCLCPGPTLTESVKKRNYLLISRSTDLFTLTPEAVAKAAITGLFKKKNIIIPGWKNKLILAISHFIPFRIKSRILMAIFEDNFELEESVPTPLIEEEKKNLAS